MGWIKVPFRFHCEHGQTFPWPPPDVVLVVRCVSILNVSWVHSHLLLRLQSCQRLVNGVMFGVHQNTSQPTDQNVRWICSIQRRLSWNMWCIDTPREKKNMKSFWVLNFWQHRPWTGGIYRLETLNLDIIKKTKGLGSSKAFHPPLIVDSIPASCFENQ